MIFREERRDLFTLPKDYILVHCIDATARMGAGIAREFTRLGIKDALIKSRGTSGSTHNRSYFDGKGYCIFVTTEKCPWTVANLVTKARHYEKPTYKTIKDALHDLKCGLLSCYPNVKHIGMPLIGCGLDKLEWSKVSEIIKNQFADTDIEITVCKL